MRIKIILFLAACAVLSVAAQSYGSDDAYNAELYCEDDEDLASELSRRQAGGIRVPVVKGGGGAHGGQHGGGGLHASHGAKHGGGGNGHGGIGVPKGGPGKPTIAQGHHTGGGMGGPGNDGEHAAGELGTGLVRRHAGKTIPPQAPTGVDSHHNPFHGHQNQHQNKGHGASASHKAGDPDFPRSDYSRLEPMLSMKRRAAGKSAGSDDALKKATKTNNQEIPASRHPNQGGGGGGSEDALSKSHVPTKAANQEIPPSRHPVHAGDSGNGDGDLEGAPIPTKSASQELHKGNAGDASARRSSKLVEVSNLPGKILKYDLHENPFAPLRERSVDSGIVGSDSGGHGGPKEHQGGGGSGHGSVQGGSGGHFGSGGHSGSGGHLASLPDDSSSHQGSGGHHNQNKVTGVQGSGFLGPGDSEGKGDPKGDAPHAAPDTGHLRKESLSYASAHKAAKSPSAKDVSESTGHKAAKPPANKDLFDSLAKSGHTVEKPPSPKDMESEGEKIPGLGSRVQSASKAAKQGGHFQINTAPGILMPSGGLPSKIKGEFGSHSARVSTQIGKLGGGLD